MKTALITGATSGIGKATAELLAKNNWRLIICGRNVEVLSQMKADLSVTTEIFTLNFDIREFSQVEKAINSIPENWKKIDEKYPQEKLEVVLFNGVERPGTIKCLQCEESYSL